MANITSISRSSVNHNKIDAAASLSSTSTTPQIFESLDGNSQNMLYDWLRSFKPDVLLMNGCTNDRDVDEETTRTTNLTLEMMQMVERSASQEIRNSVLVAHFCGELDITPKYMIHDLLFQLLEGHIYKIAGLKTCREDMLESNPKTLWVMLRRCIYLAKVQLLVIMFDKVEAIYVPDETQDTTEAEAKFQELVNDLHTFLLASHKEDGTVVKVMVTSGVPGTADLFSNGLNFSMVELDEWPL